MKQPETLIQKKIQKWIKATGGDSWKVHGSGMQRVGEPDIDGWLPYEYGHIHLKLEVKTPTGVPSKIQVVRLRKYWKAEYLAAIVTSVQELELYVQAYTDFIGNGLIHFDKPFTAYMQEVGLTDEYGIYENR